MNSTTSSVSSTKYDPDLLRSDVALARNRVARLKRELEQINMEMQYKQQGVDRLTRFAHLYFYFENFSVKYESRCTQSMGLWKAASGGLDQM